MMPKSLVISRNTGEGANESLREFQAKLCVGLTGGIGSGKNTVARLFEALGAAIIDTDAIAHQLTQAGGGAMTMISAAFGANYIAANGALDRGKMRELVFSDASAKLQLENILHPMILTACVARIRTEARAPYIMLMAPLLLESAAFLQLVQRVLLIDCSERNQISRVMQRSGLDENQIRAIIAGQLSPDERRSRADDIIQNDSAPEDLVEPVFTLHQHYLSIGKQTPFDGD